MVDEICSKLYEKLKPSGWSNVLKAFLLSEDFKSIVTQLVRLKEDDKRFTPPLKYMFSAFEDCPVENLKAVIIGQDPYPYIGVPDGKAFSCSLTHRPEASLRQIFAEIKRTVYNSESYIEDPDLTRWSKQGILLLNTSLSVELNRPNSHKNIWRPFIVYLLSQLAQRPDLVYVFMGKVAAEYAPLVKGTVIKTYHPASAAYQNSTWNCEDCFNKINEKLTEKIIW